MSAETLRRSTLEAVWDAARDVDGRERLPFQVRENLRIWAEGRVRRGVDPEALPDLVRGADGRVQEDTSRALDRAAPLDQSLDALQHALDAGSLDDELEALRRLEAEGRDRPDVLGVIDARTAKLAHDALLEKPLTELAEALGTTAWDDVIDTLWELEEGRFRRKGAFELFEDRRRVRGQLAILDDTVEALQDWLARHPDAPLDALAAAERVGKDRKTALAAIDAAR